jgi:hypothetical protein
MKTVGDAERAGYAFCAITYKADGSLFYVLYDPNVLFTGIRDVIANTEATVATDPLSNHVLTMVGTHWQRIKCVHKFQEAFVDCVVASIVTTKSLTNSARARVVGQSIARDGYGPLLYDVAMSNGMGLIPDRYSVSRSASHVWKKYFNDRHDVRKAVLHREVFECTYMPKRLFTTYSHHSNKKKHFNTAYFLPKCPRIARLIENHAKACITFTTFGRQQLGSMAQEPLSKLLTIAADEKFDRVHG